MTTITTNQTKNQTVRQNTLRLSTVLSRRVVRASESVRRIVMDFWTKGEFSWLAPDPDTESQAAHVPRRPDVTPIFNPRYGLPLKCVNCNAHAMHGLPRCFECHHANLRKIGAKWLPAVLAILAVVVPFALCVLHACQPPP